MQRIKYKFSIYTDSMHVFCIHRIEYCFSEGLKVIEKQNLDTGEYQRISLNNKIGNIIHLLEKTYEKN